MLRICIMGFFIVVMDVNKIWRGLLAASTVSQHAVLCSNLASCIVFCAVFFRVSDSGLKPV